MRTYFTPLLLALSIAAGTAMVAHAQTTPSTTIPNDGTLLNVSAEAEAKRVPDIATLSAGVVTQATDGNAAMRQNAQQMHKVMAAVKAAGIADKDVQTSGINLSPQYLQRKRSAQDQWLSGQQHGQPQGPRHHPLEQGTRCARRAGRQRH